MGNLWNVRDNQSETGERRHTVLVPEDGLILENLKLLQDVSSPEQRLLSCQEDNIGQTFNNSLVAMAFILKGEKERAERILDFYANSVDRDNVDRDLQNFYCAGEARGFYQSINLRNEGDKSASYASGLTDRWMGDLVWLTLAFKYYEKIFGFSFKPVYSAITKELLKLIVSFYQDDPNSGGYIQSGWRWGPYATRKRIEELANQGTAISDFISRCGNDSPREEERELYQLLKEARNDDHLHEIEAGGHHEGNIDCYALLRLIGEDEKAGRIAKWLDLEISRFKANDWNVYLDHVSWRALACGRDFPALYEKLYILENDDRFRKTVQFNGKKTVGFYHKADTDVNNLWNDGSGHMACAFYAAGDIEKGNFYANQMDNLIIDRIINGRHTHAIPYTANQSGPYGWVSLDKGFVSVSAWYIFAKNRFNPLDLR